MKRRNVIGTLLSLAMGLTLTAVHAQNAPPKYFTGLLPSPKGKLEAVAKPLALSLGDECDQLTLDDLPDQVLLTDYLPPIGRQGSQQSCAAWSAGYYAFSYAVAKRQGLTPQQLRLPEHQFSPVFLYGLRPQANKDQPRKDEGMNFHHVLNILQNYGCASMKLLPYSDKTDPVPNASAREWALAYSQQQSFESFHTMIKGRQTKETLLAMKAYLAFEELPLIVGLEVGMDFMQVRGDGVYRFPNTKTEPSGHAMTIIGYNKGKRAFRLANSWGTEWGDKGFVWIEENSLLGSLVSPVVMIRPAGPFALNAKPGDKPSDTREPLDLRRHRRRR